jgi:integrase
MTKDPDTIGLTRKHGIYWLQHQRNHKRVRVSLETKDLPEAIEKARLLRGREEMNPGGLLEAEIERYLAHKIKVGEFTRNTEANAKQFLRHLPREIGNVAPHRVTPADAKRFYDALKARGITESSVQTYIAHARSFFRWAVNIARNCEKNHFDTLDMPELVIVARKEYCRPELRDKLLAECPREDLRFCLFCGFHAGLRKNEIVEARPNWFDLDNGLLTIAKIDGRMAEATGLDTFDLKDKEERTIPISTPFAAFLRKWLKPDDDYCLDPRGRRGTSRYRYDPRRFFEEYMAAKKSSWVTFHTMRRTFATIQATNGTPIYTIAKWLGDDVETTQRHYGHLIPDHGLLDRGITRAVSHA